jgi:predicted nucleic acid-binding protein
MTGDTRVFVDTNILVYAHDVRAGRKNQIAQRVVSELWQTRQGVMSTQVLQEFYVTVCRKLSTPLDRSTARRIVDTYRVWDVHTADVSDIVAASEIEERYQLSFWEALILSAARRLHADRLLTEDLQAGQRIEGILVENPFTDSVKYGFTDSP